METKPILFNDELILKHFVENHPRFQMKDIEEVWRLLKKSIIIGAHSEKNLLDLWRFKKLYRRIDVNNLGKGKFNDLEMYATYLLNSSYREKAEFLVGGTALHKEFQVKDIKTIREEIDEKID